jgi:hypothetical protein
MFSGVIKGSTDLPRELQVWKLELAGVASAYRKPLSEQ